LTLTVSRVGSPQPDEGLVVSTLGTSVDINVAATAPIECPFAAMLEGDSAARGKSALLYTLRDNVLARTRDGRRYINLFKRHGLEVTLRLMADRPLRQQALQVFGRLLPVLQTRLAREITPGSAAASLGRPERTGVAAITSTDVTDIEVLINSLMLKASPELRSTLVQLKRELKSGRIASVMGIAVKSR
jgi:hypothetical protein